jgi:hypothetical protein
MENSATGFSPFPLLFGRNVKGPLSLLHQQLAEKSEGEKPVTEYVESLKERLRKTWKLAAENDDKAKQKVKHLVTNSYGIVGGQVEWAICHRGQNQSLYCKSPSS